MLTLGLAAGAGYAAARALMEHELPERVPPPLRARLDRARTRLWHARARVREVLAAAHQASDDAARDLLADYHHRAGRDR